MQKHNLPAVNEAYNELLIEEEDHQSLRDSVDANDAFDSADLAARLEKHELLEFRRRASSCPRSDPLRNSLTDVNIDLAVAAHLYAKNSKWGRSIQLSKEDKLYKDAIATAAVSGSVDVAEELLRYFSDIGSRETFVATLFTAFDLIRPDVAEELSWRHAFADVAMPYKLQVARLQADKVAALSKQLEALSTRAVKEEEQENSAPILGLGNSLAIGWQ